MDQSESFVAHATWLGCPFMRRRLRTVAHLRLISRPPSRSTCRDGGRSRPCWRRGDEPQPKGAPRSRNAARTSATKRSSGFLIGCLATTHGQSPRCPTASTSPGRAVRFRPSPSENGPIQPPVRARTRLGASRSTSRLSSSIADRRCARWRSVPTSGRRHLVQVRPREAAGPPGIVEFRPRLAEHDPSQHAPEGREIRVVDRVGTRQVRYPLHSAAIGRLGVGSHPFHRRSSDVRLAKLACRPALDPTVYRPPDHEQATIVSSAPDRPEGSERHIQLGGCRCNLFESSLEDRLVFL
jgi:hypothetical protein